MLNGLAGYLFGGRSENGISPSVDNGRRSPAGRDEVDGWILVDNEPELDIVALPSSTESSGSVSPVTTIEALGWNLTPPPCFTISQQQHEQQQQLSDGQKTVVDKQSPSENRPSGTVAKLALTPRGRHDDGQPVPPMEISVFENLLIEHPSMSVYRRRPGVPPTSGSDDGAGVKGGQRRGNKCRWPLIAATMTPLSITQGAPTTPTPLDDDVVDQSAAPIVAPPSAGGARRSVVDDFMHFFGGATCRRDVWRAATAAQQRVERAAKGRDCGTNRMRRQSTTNAATTADAAKVVQRKRRMRKQSARSNDRKCQ